MAGLPGAGLSFKIGDATNVLTEIATYLESLGADASSDELDATTFTPGATQPVKSIIFGATDRTYTLSGRWVPAVETLFSAISMMQDRNYEHGPEGTASGKVKISGTVNVGPYSGPQQDVAGVISFSITLKVNSRTVGTF
jgi:hypothetical protein